jgi:hypothetical protein
MFAEPLKSDRKRAAKLRSLPEDAALAGKALGFPS